MASGLGLNCLPLSLNEAFVCLILIDMIIYVPSTKKRDRERKHKFAHKYAISNGILGQAGDHDHRLLNGFAKDLTNKSACNPTFMLLRV